MKTQVRIFRGEELVYYKLDCVSLVEALRVIKDYFDGAELSSDEIVKIRQG